MKISLYDLFCFLIYLLIFLRLCSIYTAPGDARDYKIIIKLMSLLLLRSRNNFNRNGYV